MEGMIYYSQGNRSDGEGPYALMSNSQNMTHKSSRYQERQPLRRCHGIDGGVVYFCRKKCSSGHFQETLSLFLHQKTRENVTVT